MRLVVSWRSSLCSVVDRVARQECGPSRISEIWFFFPQTKTKQNRSVADLTCSPCVCDLWPPHLLVQWPCKIRHWLHGCRWADGCPWTWLFEVPSVTHSGLWPGLISPSVLKVGDDTCKAHLLAPSPDGKFLLGSLAGVKSVPVGSLGWENWNLEVLKVSHLSLFHFTLIYI